MGETMKKGEPITQTDLHLAIRSIIAGTRFHSFRLTTTSFEEQNDRIDVDYMVHIEGLKPRAYFQSREPWRLLSWIRGAVKGDRIGNLSPVLATVSHLYMVK